MANTANEKARAAMQFLMQAGAVLGLWFCTEYFIAAEGLTSIPFMLVTQMMRIGTIVILFLLIRKLRDVLFYDGFLWIQSWMYGIQLMFFGGLIEAICIYAYCSWINPDFLLELHHSAIAQLERIPALMEALGINTQAEQSLDQINRIVEAFREQGPDSPIDAAINALSGDIFAGMILMVPISFILRRRRTPATN